MRYRLAWLSLAILPFVVGCRTGAMPESGDEVKPGLAGKIQWEAGKAGELWVALYASGPKGSNRMLDFDASKGKNPVANITFYDSEGSAISPPVTVSLDTRC